MAWIDTFWNTVFSTTVSNPVLLVLFSCLFGLFVSKVCAKYMGATRSMRISLIILPALTTSALLAVNGNLGVSVAILGVFGLTRFKSFPGTSLDIMSIFFAMAVGLLVSTGQIVETALITLIVSFVIIAACKTIKTDNSLHEIGIFCSYSKTNIEEIEKVLLQNTSFYNLEEVQDYNEKVKFVYKAKLKNTVNVQTMKSELKKIDGSLIIVIKHLDVENTTI